MQMALGKTRRVEQPVSPMEPSKSRKSRNLGLRRSWRSPSSTPLESFATFLVWSCSLVSVATTIGIIVFLTREAVEFFQQISIWEFITGTQWSPLWEPKHFGILPLLSGTLVVGVGACLIAVPIGALSALFLSEYTAGSWRVGMKSLLEVLAGVPSVVYGFFAVTFITPQLRTFIPDLEVFNALSAAIVVGIMIIPTIASVSQDAFQAVPRELREAAYGLGARKYQVACTVVFPSALSGFIASVILGFSRAIGETMAVSLAAGATPNMSWNPVHSIQTMTAYIVQVSLGDISAGTIEYSSLFAVGLTLFAMTLGANVVANFIVQKFQGSRV